MVGMECQGEMEETESQGDEGRGENLVCRDHLARKVCMHEQSTNHTSLKNRPMTRCYAKSPTAQDAIWPIPGLISCTGVTGRWGLLSCAQNAARWLVLFKRLVKALWRHLILMQLSFKDRLISIYSFLAVIILQKSVHELYRPASTWWVIPEADSTSNFSWLLIRCINSFHAEIIYTSPFINTEIKFSSRRSKCQALLSKSWGQASWNKT